MYSCDSSQFLREKNVPWLVVEMSLQDSNNNNNNNNNNNQEGQYTPTLVLQIMIQMAMKIPHEVPRATNRDKTCVVQ